MSAAFRQPCVLFLAGILAWLPAGADVMRTDGRMIRDGQGKVVVLRGVNLGGWLEWQSWMCPIDSSGTLRDLNPGHNGFNYEVRGLLERRFGRKVAEDLVSCYLDAWLTSADLDQIRDHGLNAVRLPLAYDMMVNDDGSWRADAFTRIDWLLKEAWSRGIHTILDFHAFLPPRVGQDGGRTGYWAREDCMAETADIWKKIAARYRGRPEVAMYDLLNEPNNSALHHHPAPDSAAIRAQYDRLYRAVRSADPDHIITMEGVWDWQSLRDPREAGYTNFVVSLHWYNWGEKSTEGRLRATDRDLGKAQALFAAWGVPLFVGEFNLFGDAKAWEHALAGYDRLGLSWTFWNFKHKAAGTNSWGLLTSVPGKSPPEPNLVTDSADDICRKWRAWATRPGVVEPNPMLSPIVRRASGR